MMNFTGLESQKVLLRDDIDRRVGKVIDHGQFIMGPEVAELEFALKAFCGSKHAITVANGTDALQIALMAKGIGHGHSVLVPSFTYTATAEVILVLGARPLFVDVDPDTFNIDMKSLARAYDEAKRAGHVPKAIIAVDLFGLPADWPSLNQFAQDRALFLIADAAQSFGAATATGERVGKLAPVTTTSFFPAKPLGCYGDGGAIFTEDDELASVMRSIRVHGQGKEKYETERVGMNSRLDTIQAAVLLSKLTVFSTEVKNRGLIASTYNAKLGNQLTLPRSRDGAVSTWAQYTIRTARRNELQAALKKQGVPTVIYYPKPMHQQQAYAIYHKDGVALPQSEELSQTVLSLPMNPYASNAEVEAICDAVAISV